MRFDEAFLEELRSRTPLAGLISRKVKLSRSGRQMKGCCPFHGEKTPSFYVYEDGYHCFGCGAHGDAISFVMQTGGATFPEAVATLAGEAGLDLPRENPDAVAAERRRLDLHAVLDAAQQYFRDALTSPAGAVGLAYLRRRGLTDATIARFGLGWAGEGRGALATALRSRDITAAQLLEAGLLRADEDGAIRGELFFNRVMFPIRDRTGRMISFGGRMLGDGQPKYVNGPETPVFSKRRTLYALDFAREAARRGEPVVVVEGYMDVIALHQAGFPGAVAPLGTALTPEQLAEIWRLSPAPTICFDGDAAGARAAERAIMAALPQIAADRTVQIAMLADGDDPDTLVGRQGSAGFAAALKAARPLDEALFLRLRHTSPHKTPEQRHHLQQKLDAAANTIGDRGLAAEYRRALRDRLFGERRRGAAKPIASRARLEITSDATTISRLHALTAILVNHPDLLHDLEEAYSTLPLPAALQPMREAMLAYVSQTDSLDSAGLVTHLRSLGLEAELSRVLDGAPSCGAPGVQPAEAAAGWWHFYGLMHRGELEQAKQAAQKFVAENGDDATAWARLDALSRASFRLSQGQQTDDDTDDAVPFKD